MTDTDDARPCRYETFSGECLHCGAQIGEECVWEWELEQIRERRRNEHGETY